MLRESLTITLAIFALCQASETFDNAAAESLMCSKNCTDKYASKELVIVCQRGCRFHVIEELFMKSDLNATQMKLACYGSCVDSYSEDSSSTDVCNDGCDIQQKIVLNDKEAEEEPSIHLLSPLVRVHAIYTSVVGAVHVIRSSFITYFIRDDNKIVAVESEPKILLGIDSEAAANEDNPLAQSQESRQFALDEENNEPSVVSCLSQQIGVPPYILIVSVVALVIFSLYVIIALFGTKTTKSKAFANEKNMDIDAAPLPVKVVRPEDLTRLTFAEEDDLQAPPLPTKVKLPNTMI